MTPTPKHQIKLMPDYQCYPLWWFESDQVGNIDPSELPLSQETIGDLERWADAFDRLIDLGNPSASPEPSPEVVDAIDQEGLHLWKRLLQELGPEWRVVYKSPKSGMLLTEPDLLADTS